MPVVSSAWRRLPEDDTGRSIRPGSITETKSLTGGKESGMSEKIGVALWSLGKTRTEEELRRSLETTAEIGLRGVQPWCVGEDCVLDPDRCTGDQRRKMRDLIGSYGLSISGFCAQLEGPKRFGGLNEVEGLDARIEKTK